MPRKGELKPNVERYPCGQIKYERDYKAQYEANLGRRTIFSVKVEPELANKFNAKLAAEGTTKNAKIKEWIMDYLSGKLK